MFLGTIAARSVKRGGRGKARRLEVLLQTVWPDSPEGEAAGIGAPLQGWRSAARKAM
jgi:hypothetical protein